MEKLYKDIYGVWCVSEWENGKKYITGEDGHTYTAYENENRVDHVECWCFYE
jgi:hypothetical protein